MATLSNVWYIVMVVLGLGFVIFWHELGHFLLAKRNDVRVETFSIGFGPVLVSWRQGLGFRLFRSSAGEYAELHRAAREGRPPGRDLAAVGETEYVLSAIPLGGFVKMLGEGPEDEQSRTTDPRAFSNKKVGARMAIISAGVIMNVILGLACFVFAYKWGKTYTPPILGGVKAATPAYQAGLRPGDEIVALNGRRDATFDDLRMASGLSRPGEAVTLELRRPGAARPIVAAIEPIRAAAAAMPTIGITHTHALTLEEDPWIEDLAGRDGTLGGSLQPGDRIVRAGPVGGPLEELEPAADRPADAPGVPPSEQLRRLMTRFQAEPLVVEVVRAAAPGAAASDATTRATATLPPNRFLDFGFRLAIGPIGAIRADSPAEGKLRRGDVIRKVDGQEFDPMRLPSLCYERAGEPLDFEVERAGDGPPETLHLEITPEATPPPWPIWEYIIGLDDELDVPGLGVCYPVQPKIAAIRPGSPAAKAGLKVGDVIEGLAVPPSGPQAGADTPFEVQFNATTGATWVSAFAVLQLLPRSEVHLTLAGAPQLRKIRPEPDPSWFNPMRGLRFQHLELPLPPQSIGQAITRGLRDTRDGIVSIYQVLRGLIQRRLGRQIVAGPVRIFDFGHRVASEGIAPFIHFLGVLSINLAVINFLPIPPLDGGQFLFLSAEAVRGRPLPESVLAAGTYAGVLLVLSLIIFVTTQDIWLIL